jgi:phage FluMu protein Com
VIKMLGKLIRKIRGQKQIRCRHCKQLKTVPKGWHWLKWCPDCQARGDTLIKILKEGFTKKYGMTFEE